MCYHWVKYHTSRRVVRWDNMHRTERYRYFMALCCILILGAIKRAELVLLQPGQIPEGLVGQTFWADSIRPASDSIQTPTWNRIYKSIWTRSGSKEVRNRTVDEPSKMRDGSPQQTLDRSPNPPDFVTDFSMSFYGWLCQMVCRGVHVESPLEKSNEIEKVLP